MNAKPTYNELLKLFFGVQDDTFQLPDFEKSKLQKVQKYLKHLYFNDAKEIYSFVDRLFGSLPENRFFQEETILEEIADLFAVRKIEIEKLAENLQAWTKTGSLDCDVLAYNSTTALVINLYSAVETEDLDRFLEDLSNFKYYFQEFKDHTVYGVMGVIEIGNEQLKQAVSKGLFVLRKSGDNVKILNRKNFKPTSW